MKIEFKMDISMFLSLWAQSCKSPINVSIASNMKIEFKWKTLVLYLLGSYYLDTERHLFFFLLLLRNYFEIVSLFSSKHGQRPPLLIVLANEFWSFRAFWWCDITYKFFRMQLYFGWLYMYVCTVHTLFFSWVYYIFRGLGSPMERITPIFFPDSI